MKRRRVVKIRETRPSSTANLPAGVIGLGLMGTSIATCLLAAGHPVVGIDTDPRKRRSARRREKSSLKFMYDIRALALKWAEPQGARPNPPAKRRRKRNPRP